MTVRVSIDTRQVEAMARNLRNPKPVVSAIRDHQTRSATLIRDNARKAAPKDQGGLRQDIRYEIFTKLVVSPTAVEAESRVLTDLPYSMPMEAGTRPFWPPVGPLKAWAVRHGMPERVGYAIQRTIARRGLKPRLYMNVGRTAARRKISADVRKTMDEIAQAWGAR